ncbi:MAG: hypothetical protein AB7U98_14685 [Candidatus Nitrosocosmicus sp.]
MIIRVDLHFLPENLKSLIINSKELNQYATTNLDGVSTTHEVELGSIRLFEFVGYFSSFKGLLKLVLQNNSLNDYIVAEDLDSANTLVILKNGNVEQLDIWLCDFCGLACASEEEKYIHQRAHYFI